MPSDEVGPPNGQTGGRPVSSSSRQQAAWCQYWCSQGWRSSSQNSKMPCLPAPVGATPLACQGLGGILYGQSSIYKEIKDGLAGICDLTAAKCYREFHKLRKVTKQGLEEIFHSAFSKTVKFDNWSMANQDNRKTFEFKDRFRPTGSESVLKLESLPVDRNCPVLC